MRYFYLVSAIVLSVAAMLSAACNLFTPALTLKALANAEYQVEYMANKRVKLTDGRYSESIAPGSATRISVKLADTYAIADLNGDGAKDAVVVLIVDSGGSGTFYYLAAVINEKGTPKHVASLLLGDRVKLKTVMVKSSEIIIQMTTHGPKDPLCCPTQDVTQTYRLEGNKLIALS